MYSDERCLYFFENLGIMQVFLEFKYNLGVREQDYEFIEIFYFVDWEVKILKFKQNKNILFCYILIFEVRFYI